MSFYQLSIYNMINFKLWISRQISKAQSSPLWRLFLIGLKGQTEIKNPKPYNFYIKILTTTSIMMCAYYFLLFSKIEMDILGHNIFIPNYVYKVRE
jgi:hypothetical protein